MDGEWARDPSADCLAEFYYVRRVARRVDRDPLAAVARAPRGCGGRHAATVLREHSDHVTTAFRKRRQNLESGRRDAEPVSPTRTGSDHVNTGR